MNLPEFEQYMSSQEPEEHIFDEQTELINLAIGSDFLVVETEKICEYLDQAYEKLSEFSKQYESFIKIYNENVSIKIDEYFST